MSKQSRPGVRFPAAGLVTLDANGKPASWRATFWASGGQGYVYLKERADGAARDAALAIARDLAVHPDATGIAKIRLPDEIRSLGGDPAAAFALEAADGFGFSNEIQGELVVPSPLAGHHGYDPARADMQASMIFYGPAIAHSEIHDARLVDVAPTVAPWLGLTLPATGLALPVRFAKDKTGPSPEPTP